jgi:prolyl-tRNA editing enzyme YbaK/EbsC (Cys-tRNA(Pro) deacylase)
MLDPTVIDALNTYGLTFRILKCNPDMADTATFCEHYGFSLQQSANTIVVASRKTDSTQYAACVVLHTSI